MRIGIDFDNTIANYDGVFHAAAYERGLIAADLPTSKNAVRDFLISAGRTDDFTVLRGYVYGARMDLVSPFPGISEFIAAARARAHELFVISHKTRRPILGPDYDMHAAALRFLSDNGLVGPAAIGDDNVYFEPSQEQKIGRAAVLRVDIFIDDLSELLLMPGFPPATRRILFSPSGLPTGDGRFEICRSWREISDRLFGGIP